MLEFPLCYTCSLFKLPKDVKPLRTRPSGYNSKCRLCTTQRAWLKKYGTLEGFRPIGWRALRCISPEMLEVERLRERAQERTNYHKNIEQSREKARTKGRALYAKNLAAGKKRPRKLSADSRKKARTRDKRYRKNHPEVGTRKAARRRSRMTEGLVFDKVTLALLHKRDKGICSLCSHPVSRRLKFPHPMSGTIDHIIPLAQGGEHSYQNTALAHFFCNSAKSNRIATQQMRLFG